MLDWKIGCQPLQSIEGSAERNESMQYSLDSPEGETEGRCWCLIFRCPGVRPLRPVHEGQESMHSDGLVNCHHEGIYILTSRHANTGDKKTLKGMQMADMAWRGLMVERYNRTRCKGGETHWR